MKILFIDIETSPNLAYVWGLWKQNVAVSQIVDSTDMLCWAARFHDGKMVYRARHNKGFLERLWKMMDTADVLCHFNGKKFDVPHINREFLQADMLPPSPYKQIDLLHVARATFRFPSNKLEYIAQKRGMGQKVEHEGFKLWTRCMAGDRAAWGRMRAYNEEDVELLVRLYDKLQPWIRTHPNMGLFQTSDGAVCMNCGEETLIKRGYAYTSLSKFQRYRCTECGKWQRGRTNLASRDELTTSIAG